MWRFPRLVKLKTGPKERANQGQNRQKRNHVHQSRGLEISYNLIPYSHQFIYFGEFFLNYFHLHFANHEAHKTRGLIDLRGIVDFISIYKRIISYLI